MTLRTEEGTLIWRRKLWIAVCGGIVLEEALNMSSDRLLDDDDIQTARKDPSQVYRLRQVLNAWKIKLSIQFINSANKLTRMAYPLLFYSSLLLQSSPSQMASRSAEPQLLRVTKYFIGNITTHLDFKNVTNIMATSSVCMMNTDVSNAFPSPIFKDSDARGKGFIWHFGTCTNYTAQHSLTFRNLASYI